MPKFRVAATYDWVGVSLIADQEIKIEKVIEAPSKEAALAEAQRISKAEAISNHEGEHGSSDDVDRWELECSQTNVVLLHDEE